MAKSKKIQPTPPEEIAEWTTQQFLRRARECRNYWQQRSEAILKQPSPTPGQLESQPWYEQHALIWGGLAEKLDQLAEIERAERQRQYEQGLTHE